MALSEITNTVYVHVKMFSGVANETHFMKIIVTTNNPFEDNNTERKSKCYCTQSIVLYLCTVLYDAV